MIYRLPLRVRQFLAVALLLATVGLVALLTIVPFLLNLAAARERLVQQRTFLGQLQDATSGAAAASPTSRDAGFNKAMTGLFIEGDSEAIRLASLQSQGTDSLTRQSVKSRSSRNLQTRERHTLKLVGVQVQLTATVEQLQKILLAIEAHRPILLVDALHLTPAAAVGTDDDRGILEARLDVLAIEARPADASRQKAP